MTATLLALLVKIFLADLAVVDGRSMEPFFSRGSIVLVIRCAYGIRSPGSGGSYWIRWDAPHTGDIVLAFPPKSGKRVVKRVTALEPPKGNRTQGDESREFPKGVPRAEEFFLVGDNPPESRDSRDYGPVRVDTIAGKVFRLRR